ncbi:uncharacterized protein LOC123559541 isoform X1 [Mercenaria mercenaria]|uniref:uncharacterized protein LOC123559541 isoform X1 n=1 Tax=Mercenaria mercenaria TaxID=6596 RepID=UPI00234E908B|nr:uncharacterized protein LOC123559541 isoform X1 [Mercenaria mercenaria]
MLTTSVVPFSGSEQVTLTSKETEEITTNVTHKETVITHKDDMYATNEVPYSKSDQDQVTVASNVTEVTTNETAEKTSATIEHDMYTNEVPFSGSEQVTLTSKVNEEITTNETPKETVITHKDDMYATNEVPYSKSDQVTVVSKVTDSTITTMIGGICGVLLITVLTTVTIIKLRKKRCTTNETEEGDKQQSGSYLYDAQCCEINQLEDERVTIGIKLQTFSSSEPDAVPVNNTTCRKNSCLNTRAVEDESGNEYAVIEYDSKASHGHESATEYCRKKTVDYENYEISTMTVESGNEYETIKY